MLNLVFFGRLSSYSLAGLGNMGGMSSPPLIVDELIEPL